MKSAVLINWYSILFPVVILCDDSIRTHGTGHVNGVCKLSGHLHVALIVAVATLLAVTASINLCGTSIFPIYSTVSFKSLGSWINPSNPETWFSETAATLFVIISANDVPWSVLPNNLVLANILFKYKKI